MVDFRQANPQRSTLAGTVAGDDVALLDDIIRSIGRLPDGVEKVDFRLGEDSEGEPAVWIVVKAREDLNPSKEKIAALRRVANDVRSKVISSGSHRWPYIEIATR